MLQLFGTDGVRGVYGTPRMDEALAARLAGAAADFFSERPACDQRLIAVVGRDTRASGEKLSAAIIRALLDSGWSVIDLGILPTPAIALECCRNKAACGFVVTASHNPSTDNGIKLLASGGRKLTEEEEARIEALFERDSHTSAGRHGGGTLSVHDAASSYIQHMTRRFSNGGLDGWKIAVDCAHGATAGTTPAVLRALGAKVIAIGCEPNGANINANIGSEHPAELSRAVLASGATIGIAHDGDGDRLVVCDETGSLLSGDELLAIIGLHGIRLGWLRENTLVVTMQSNLGLDAVMEKAGGAVVRTPVGDRYVAETMRRRGLTVGGESSGHCLFFDVGPSGDGLAGALKLFEIMHRTGEPISRLRTCLRAYPQRMVNVPVREKRPIDSLPLLAAAIERAQLRLGSRGRVMIRYSGTEPLLRLLVEGPDERDVVEILADLRQAAITSLE